MVAMGSRLRNALAARVFVLAGVGLAAAYWLVESVVLDVLIFRVGAVAERLLLTSDPHEFWHRAVAVVIFVAAGIIAQRLVNKRRRIQERQAQLAAIVESSDEAIVGAKLDGTVTSWNPAAEALYGYTAEEMIGRSALELVPPDRRRELSEGLEEVGQGRSVRADESLHVGKDGGEMWASESSRLPPRSPRASSLIVGHHKRGEAEDQPLVPRPLCQCVFLHLRSSSPSIATSRSSKNSSPRALDSVSSVKQFSEARGSGERYSALRASRWGSLPVTPRGRLRRRARF